ncbi:nicotinic acid mononucleotide adenylyltransferase [Pseudomonas putida S11]|nr:nicotinic acid mononucleotide adenylyltransferase [Pseudomonas putida S11]
MSKAQAVRRIGHSWRHLSTPCTSATCAARWKWPSSWGLDELRLLPNARPPHRDTPQVAAQDRLAMVQGAVQGVPCLSVDARELARDKPSYTIDTLESIRAELAADDQLFLVLGWDAFCGLPGWHRWEELLQHCHILVLQRPDADVEPPDELRNLLAARSESDPTALSGPAGNISFVWQTPLAVSATQIRQLLASGEIGEVPGAGRRTGLHRGARTVSCT